MRSTSSKLRAGSRNTCPTPRCRAAFRTSRSPSAATTSCARRCTRSSSTTPSQREWTWASSIPQLLQVYSDIEPALLERVEDVVLCRRADAAERLIDYAQHLRTDTAAEGAAHEEAWRTRPLPERIEYALLRGVTDHIETDTLEAYRELGDPMQVIDRLLMRAMARVGELFGQGKMFLPQVVKSARVMKRAVGGAHPLYRTECRRPKVGGQGDRGHGQGRRPRHRQKHRRGGHGLQRLRDPRPGRHGRGAAHRRRSGRMGRRRDLPERPDHPRRSTR